MLKNRFVILDLLRLIFALAVALGHFHGYGATPKVYLAVDFFFVLSGFVLCAAYEKRSQRPGFFGSFMADRIARLYPLHLLILLVLLAMNVAFYLISNGQLLENGWSYQDGRLYTFILNVFLAQNWGFTKFSSWNDPSWSVSVELLVNVFLAAALMELRHAGKNWPIVLAGAVAISGYALLFNSLDSLGHTSENLGGFMNVGLLRGFAGIALGFLCFLAFDALRMRAIGTARLIGPVALALAIATFALIWFGAGLSNLDFAMIPIMFCLVLATALYEASSPVRPRLAAIFEGAGALSYAVYLIHWPIAVFSSYFLVYLWHLPIHPEGRLATGIFLTVILLISWPVHSLFEIPMKRRVRALMASNPPPIGSIAGSQPTEIALSESTEIIPGLFRRG